MQAFVKGGPRSDERSAHIVVNNNKNRRMSILKRALAVLPTRELVDDDVLLYIMRHVLTAGHDAIVVDSIVLSLAIDQADAKSIAAIGALFRDARETGTMIFVPVHEAIHWSLLVYRPVWHQWYSCDSIRDPGGVGYHHRRHIRILAMLAQNDIVVAEENSLFIYDDMPQQPEGFECARYVLFYTLALLSVFTEYATDRTGCEERLECELRKVCEANRPAFEALLMTVMTRIKQ